MRFVISSLLLALGCSCAPVYTAAPPSAPLIRDQGDLALCFSLSAVTVASASVAYAFADNVSIYAEAGHDPNDGAKTSHEFGDVAVALGLHPTIGSTARLDLFAGAGYGYGSSIDDSSPRGSSILFPTGPTTTIETTLKARHHRLFGQIDVGLASPEIQFAYQLRANYLQIEDLRMVVREYEMNELRSETSSRTDLKQQWSLEHGVVLRIPWKQVHLQAFAIVAHFIPSREANVDLFAPVNVGVGLHYRFNVFG